MGKVNRICIIFNQNKEIERIENQEISKNLAKFFKIFVRTRKDKLWVRMKHSRRTNTMFSILVGLVGELQREKSDIGWANVYMIPDRMQYIDYTDPYLIEYASFMLSKMFQF